MRKVRIKKVPQARTGYQVQGSLANDVPAMGGADYNAYIGMPKPEISKFISRVPREEANLEAEGGETVYGDINGDGMAEHKIIKGPRHAQGGVPLSLPDDTFIFSDYRGMKINDPDVLQNFGKSKQKGRNKGYTPAELAKQYDVDKYRKILQDPNSDIIDRKTAELMIKNYTMKLGALALAQESKKGFPQGIPAVARPYMQAHGLKDEDFIDPEVKQTLNRLQAQMGEEEGAEVETMESEEAGADYASAEELNQGRPVAQPAPEEMMGMPTAQNGIIQRSDPGMQEYIKTMNKYYNRKGFDQEFLPAGVGPMTEDQMYNWNELQETLTPNQIPERNVGSPEDTLQRMQETTEDCPCMQEMLVQGVPQVICVPCEETPMAMYGMTMGGYDLPFAEYGMSMGANPQNYQGRTRRIPASGPMYKRGGGLYKAQSGVEVDVTGMTQEEKDRALWNARRNNPGKQIIVVNDGKKQYESQRKVDDKFYEQKLEGFDMSTWGNTPQAKLAAVQYRLLENELNNPAVLNKLCEETQASLKNPKSYVNKEGVQGRTWEQRGLAMPNCNTIKQEFLNHQKRNLVFQAKSIDPKLFTDSGQGLAPAADILARKALNPQTGQPVKTLKEAEDVKAYMRKTYGGKLKDAKGNVIDVSVNETAGKIGVPLDPSTNARALQQATFHGYAHMVENKSSYDEDTQYAIRNFIPKALQAGVDDESSMAGLFTTKGLQISPIDDFTTPDKSYYGNTTLGHLPGLGLSEYEYLDEPITPEGEKKEDPKKCPCEKTDGTVIDTGVNPNTGECNPCEEDVNVPYGQPAEWWLQDTIKTTGAFGDLMGIKKYMPWAPGVDLETPRPTFLDPTRELAAQSEQANILTQAMGQFAGPQALSSRSSQIQGQAAKQAADTLSRYNNANVNLANQFEFKATDVRNQEAMLRQAAASKLYDQNTIANQQYDNARLAMRNQLRNYYTNAITNRWKTDALNQMFPQYAVSPAVGGQMYFTEGRKPKPETSGQLTYEQAYKWCLEQGDKDPAKCATAKVNAAKGSSEPSDYDERIQVLNNMYAGDMPTGQNGGFVWGDMMFPFIL